MINVDSNRDILNKTIIDMCIDINLINKFIINYDKYDVDSTTFTLIDHEGKDLYSFMKNFTDNLNKSLVVLHDLYDYFTNNDIEISDELFNELEKIVNQNNIGIIKNFIKY